MRNANFSGNNLGGGQASTGERRAGTDRRRGKKKGPSRYKIVLPEKYIETLKRFEEKGREEQKQADQQEEEYKGPSIAEIEQQIIERKKQEKIELEEMRRSVEEEAKRIMREAEEAAFSKIKEAEEESKAIHQKTEAEIEEKVANAEKKASDIEMDIERRREEIFEQQKTKGYREGWENGYREGEQELKKMNERLESIIRAVTEKRVEIIESSERQLVEIIRLVSRKVVKKIVEDHDDIILYNIREALSRIRDKSHLTIKVNFSDLKLSLEKKQEIIGMIENLQKVEIIEDSTIEPGGCVILTDFGEIDARVSNQLSRIEDRILDMEYNP